MRIITILTLAIAASPAKAFDMDCKLILCMAGGFPANCADAKSYMIGRLTSFPPKPPIGFCDFSGGSYENYSVDHGKLRFSPEAFKCREGLSLFISGHEGRDGDPTAFCYTSARETCELERGGGELCTTTYEGKEAPEFTYEYYVDITVEPGTADSYRSGRQLVDFQ